MVLASLRVDCWFFMSCSICLDHVFLGAVLWTFHSVGHFHQRSWYGVLVMLILQMCPNHLILLSWITSSTTFRILYGWFHFLCSCGGRYYGSTVGIAFGWPRACLGLATVESMFLTRIGELPGSASRKGIFWSQQRCWPFSIGTTWRNECHGCLSNSALAESITVLKSRGDAASPWWTPVLMGNSFNSSCRIHTQLVETSYDIFRSRMILSGTCSTSNALHWRFEVY